MTVRDNTIACKNLGDFLSSALQAVGINCVQVSKRRPKIKESSGKVSEVKAYAFGNPIGSVSDVKKFCHTGKGLYLGNFV